MKRLILALWTVLLSFLFFPLTAEEIPLEKLSEELHFYVFWDYWREIALLEKEGTMLSFRPGDAFLLQNYQKRLPVEVIRRNEASQILLGEQAQAVIRTLFSQTPPVGSERQQIAAVILDPGHGGRDSGAVSPFPVNGKPLLEKEIALDIALKVYASLTKQYPDKKILLTRTGDTYPSLAERTALANGVELAKNEAVLFVSVHVNASLNQKSTGFEVWYLPPELERDLISDKMKAELPEKNLVHILNRLLDEETGIESIKLATSVFNQMALKINGRSPARGLKENAWYVVRHAKMPSVLVEVGFISNPAEAALLADSGYRTDLAVGIYNGIHQFIQQFELSNGFTLKRGEANELETGGLSEMARQ